VPLAAAAARKYADRKIGSPHPADRGAWRKASRCTIWTPHAVKTNKKGLEKACVGAEGSKLAVRQKAHCDEPAQYPNQFVPATSSFAGMLRRTLRELAAPNVRLFTAYRLENLRPDLVAGISVAAVQIPTAIAYAQLAGFPPLIGLYASILPSVVYALFGSSRQLMVGPDAATCAATLVPLAGADPTRYLQLSMALAVLVGVVCILAGLCRAGFIANFLSRPILIGFLNGMGLTIIAGQLGKILGFKMEASDFFPRLAETAAKLGQIQWPTAIFSFAFLGLKRILPLVPVPLAGIVLGIGAVLAFNLGALGVALLGPLPGGSLHFALPTTLSWDDWTTLVPSSAGVAVLSFCSAMAAGRSFAAKNSYAINANRDFIALGLANISSGLTRGFCISGADSRTAINDSVKGRTRSWAS
jgi:MFS superfamily sulfate permease-like transporter